MQVPVADTGDEFLPDIQCRKNTKGIQTNTKGTSIQCTSAQHSEVYNIDFPRRYRSYMAFSIVMCLICCCCNPLVTLLCVCPAIIGSCVVRRGHALCDVVPCCVMFVWCTCNSCKTKLGCMRCMVECTQINIFNYFVGQ